VSEAASVSELPACALYNKLNPPLLIASLIASHHRFPNTANPFKMNEEYGGDQRISENVATFIPPKGYTDDDFQYLFVESPARTDTPDGWFQNFQAGIGGSCEIYDPPVSYWCSNATQGGGAFQYKVPRGVKLEEVRGSDGWSEATAKAPRRLLLHN